ncbi:hypothetical protein ERO13_D03G036066v2 [Gossypium hirsutum]|uniref:Uncharacterized protein n=2 Tax=Gossypium TaxID=3633 RepID=A0A5J5R7X1_GOSBA|nr:hypothetical protein ES319_D06G193500v1 [Gossypium barbadense]KAG4154087.1 hypothetical protein ERO13_D03G036066v2 [Gossypium hirsutum]TYH62132.1 hypothetical protein ES332_D07G098200v1 [Gossypium tomentosum]TYH79131.1 hypothetical protein ES332_D03G040600v1 [Gossypium tomentosum]
MLLLHPFLQSGFLCQSSSKVEMWRSSSSPIRFPLISQPTSPVADLKVLLSSAASNLIDILGPYQP